MKVGVSDTEPTDNKMLLRKYVWIYAHKFYNLEEMGKCLIKYDLPKVTQKK